MDASNSFGETFIDSPCVISYCVYNFCACTLLNFYKTFASFCTWNCEVCDRSGQPDVVDGRGDRSAELSEIDERLSRLQQFMKENLK